MTDPVRVGELLPGVLAEVVDRAGHGYDRWAELVAQAGYCHHPIRLAGRVEQADRATGEIRTVYDSDREPDGVLLKACGTRRESRCPSCAAVYRADAYQLLAAGLKGGKGVPESVVGHPRLFVTFTAPSFGRVHSSKAQGRLVPPCHPHRQGARCPHGQRAGCWHRHDEDDPRLGEPLCPSCYDAQAQVLWNALAPELWCRTTIALHRFLGRLVGLQEAQLRQVVRISDAKVAEFQRRGAVHFHAVIRLDAATGCRCAGCLVPPPAGFTAELLEEVLRLAVPAMDVACPPLEAGGPCRYAQSRRDQLVPLAEQLPDACNSYREVLIKLKERRSASGISPSSSMLSMAAAVASSRTRSSSTRDASSSIRLRVMGRSRPA